jgi:hypothetical protein
MVELPQSTSKIAADHGLFRAEVMTLLVEHDIPAHHAAGATVVLSADWPRFRDVLARYCQKRARRRAAEGRAASLRIPAR